MRVSSRFRFRLCLLGLLLAAAGASSAQSICAVQGAGGASPFVGTRVTSSGVVTADFSATSLGGFFVQDPVCDADAATSDAIFVRGSGAATLGHRVSVTGVVQEVAGRTTLLLESLRDEGRFSGNLELVTLSLSADPEAARAQLEATESMLAALPEAVVIGATNHVGEAFVLPASAGIDRLFRGDPDGRRLGLAAPAGWLSLAHGDRLTSAMGIVAALPERFSLWLPPGTVIDVAASDPPPPSASPAPGALAVATYAVRLYDAVDDPARDDLVLAPEAYARALGRSVFSLGALLGAPDLVGVQGVESEGVLADLAAAPELASAGYQPLLFEGEAPDGLDLGLLYRADRLRLLASQAHQGCTFLDSGLGPCTTGKAGLSLFARPPLEARLEVVATGERLAALVVDFTGPAGSIDAMLRLEMAAHVAALAAALRAEGYAPLVLGRADDTGDSATVARLVGDGGLELLQAAGDYTQVVEGLSQQVDFVLVDAQLAPRVAAAAPLHVNVDFPTPAPGSAEGHRASDHDPVLVRLNPR